MRDRYLLVETGPQAGERHAVETGRRTVLGRGQGCTIRLGDPGLSREHLAIEFREARPWLVDLGSKNGTSVNGMPVEERPLSPGDRITSGQTALLYVDEEAAPPGADISLEDGAEVSETLSLSIDAFLTARGLAGQGLEASLLGALYRVGTLAHEETAVEPFFERVLLALAERGAAEQGLASLVDPGTGRLAGGTAHPAGLRFVLPSGLLASMTERRGVVVIEDGDRGPLAGVPLWIDRSVGGVLCLRLPARVGEVPRRALELLAILGSLVGGTAGTLRRLQSLERERTALRAGAQARYDMVGRSPAMRSVFALIEKVAPTGATVLIRGESGTGKELVARAIHYRSAAANGPFVAVNAAALPLDLVESDLFGHEKGAFTGAVSAKQGRFELAEGGTFFLDEVGDLDVRVQAKFLRVLEDGAFTRVGGTKTLRVRTRVIAATNQDLEAKVREGSFREDLFYRLRVLEVVLPPLRERPEDVELLARHYLARLGEEMGRRKAEFSDGAMAALKRHPWPGNVRELRNTVERALVLSGPGPIEAAHLGFLSAPGAATREVPTLADLERDHIRRVLDLAAGNKSQAARLLGIDRSTLYEKLKAMGGYY